jgi:hypothetical protein
MRFVGAHSVRWIIAGCIALAGAGLALLDAGVNVFYRTNPGLVLAVNPAEPRALPLTIDALILSGQRRQPSAQDTALLRQALHTMPFSSRILRQLAMSYSFEGRAPESVKLLDMANRVSRRDLLTEAMLSDAAARRGDPEAAMRHMDAALSTNRRAATVIFPLLARAMPYPDFGAVAARYLGRPWADEFLLYAAQNGFAENARKIAVTYPPAQREERFADFRGELLPHLVTEGHAASAFDYARKMAGRDGSFLTNPDLTQATANPVFAPLSWRLINGEGIYAELVGTGVLVSIDPGSRGVALERLFQLSPGTWQIAVNRSQVENGEQLLTEWRVDCLVGKTAQPVGAFPMPTTGAQARFARSITLTRSCDALRVGLFVHNLDDQRESEFRLDGFSLAQSRGSR